MAVPTNRDFWLTRDIEEGVLSPYVDVWVVRPQLEFFTDGDAMWLAPIELVDDVETILGSVTVEQALVDVGTVPEAVRECIRVNRGARA